MFIQQYVSKNVISSEHIVEREAETSFSTSHYTSTAHHSTTVTQTPSHRYENKKLVTFLQERIFTRSLLFSLPTKGTGGTYNAGRYCSVYDLEQKQALNIQLTLPLIAI